MMEKKIVKLIFIILIFIVVFFFLWSKFFDNKQKVKLKTTETEKEVYSSNIIKDVKYSTRDADGNEYIITALEGDIDYSNSSILYLKKVVALIKLENSDYISIVSDFGKYNSENFDTIFSKNVIINYLDNKISSEYVDFSLERNSMLISRKVVYTNLDKILNADVININIKTKDIKIFMYEDQKNVNIKTKN
tara:strand:+ start:311 stop:886 length:576 start_codon:yes stop_codon:yes gene_type:complete